MAAEAAMQKREVLVIVHLGNVARMEILQEPRGVREMKLRVAGFNANEEAVRRCVRETRHIENGVMWLRQFVQGEHAKNRRKRGAKNRELKRNRNEGRPAIQRAAADVHGISDRGGPVLKAKAAKA